MRANALSNGQHGLALLTTLTLLTLWGLYLFVGQLSAVQFQLARERAAAAAMAEARDALIGNAISRLPLGDAGYLRLPDLGSNAGVASEGQASLTFSGDARDLTVVGRFPWKTLDTSLARDSAAECLWYVVSGRFKIAPKTDALNWDTQGQIDIVDARGSLIARNLAAVLVASGRPLDGQMRTLGDPAYTNCGGNYDARNYLDSFNEADGIARRVNYFPGDINHRLAPNIDNKEFVLADTDHYNDRFLSITVDDIFTPLTRRSDFRSAVRALLDHFKAQNERSPLRSIGSKGSDALSCSAAPDKDFCDNWKEMLLLTELTPSSQITVNGVPSSEICGRVLIFGGRREAALGQSRSSPTEKADKLNYLEGLNRSSFNVPTAAAATFSGSAGDFTAASPATDLVRCLP